MTVPHQDRAHWKNPLTVLGIVLICSSVVLFAVGYILFLDLFLNPDNCQTTGSEFPNRLMGAQALVLGAMLAIPLGAGLAAAGHTRRARAQAIPASSDKRFSVALMLALFPITGQIGAHRFYARRWGTGILWACTGGIFFFGYLVDVILVSSGQFRDAEGQIVAARPKGTP